MPLSEPEGAGRAHGLHFEKLGTNVVLRRSGDDDEEQRRFFASVPAVPENRAVLATAEALRAPSFLNALRQACRSILSEETTRSKAPPRTIPAGRGQRPRLWLAVSGLTQPGPGGVPVAQHLVDETAVEVLVPAGPLAFVPGGTLFSSAPGGWIRFAPGEREPRFARRYPCPTWEGALPCDPSGMSGVVLEHVPAGLLARAETSRSPSGVPALPQAPHPRVLVERGDNSAPLNPRALAAAVAQLAPSVRAQLEFVPSAPRALPLGQGHQLARALGHDIVRATGFVLREGAGPERTVMRDELSGASWQPFPRALRCSPDGSTRVVAANPPPRGWEPANALAYRPVRDLGDVVARVVPAGLALGPGAATGPNTADQFSFEPHQMSIIIGEPSTPLPSHVPAALQSLLVGLEPAQRARCRLIVLGVVDERMRVELVSAAGELAQRLRFFESQSAAPSTAQPPPQPARPARSTGAPAQPAAQPVQRTAVPPLPAKRPATVAEPPVALWEQAPTVVLRHSAPAEREQEQRSDRAGSAAVDAIPARAELDATAIAPTHCSTAEERERFAEIAGAEFDEYLPSVNSALANFPALRKAGTESKSDFVAVCFYLGRGERGANTTNQLLREEGTERVREHVACLVSGLRRLPVHRGPAFRMARCEQSTPPAYEAGEVLTEPGFLSATSESDVSSEQEHLDVLIWSYTARRTSALARDGLPDEVVFPASSRFKVLETADNPESRSAPAVLMRELRPGEDSASGTLDEADESVLPRLRRALDRRRSGAARVVDDPDHVLRLSEPVGVLPARKNQQVTSPQSGQQSRQQPASNQQAGKEMAGAASAQ